ncbi:MAG: hypothetical protein H7839_04320 [Magnetococcus sp. YQC-5]
METISSDGKLRIIRDQNGNIVREYPNFTPENERKYWDAAKRADIDECKRLIEEIDDDPPEHLR